MSAGRLAGITEVFVRIAWLVSVFSVCGVACTASNEEKPADTDVGETAVDDGWDLHAFTAFDADDGSDDRLQACGQKIAYQTWKYDGEAELTLVINPGRTEYSDKFHHVVRMLLDDHQLPWDVVIWDPIGQGRSTGLRAHIDDWDNQFVCALDAVIEANVDPAEPMAFLSHSMGGLITTRWMQMHPGEVVAAVFSAPMMAFTYGLFDEGGVCQFADLSVAGGAAQNPVDEGWTGRRECEDPEQNYTHDCDIYEQWYQDPLTEIGPQTWGWISASCVALETMRAEADMLRDDIHIMQAELDTVVFNPGQDDFCAQVNDGKGDCTLTVHEGDFHELFLEFDRVEVVNEAVSFIQERQ